MNKKNIKTLLEAGYYFLLPIVLMSIILISIFALAELYK